MKLHLGCGTVYLKGYVNIDTPLNGVAHLASQRPDLVDKWATTRDQYYAKQGDLDLGAVKTREFAVDAFFDITDLPFAPGTVDEILVVQTLEHLTREQLHRALTSWYATLKIGGLLDIYVPDIDKSIELLRAADTLQLRDEAIRLIFGTRKSPLFYHHFGYERDGLSSIVAACGFGYVSTQDSRMHDYPSFELKAQKG